VIGRSITAVVIIVAGVTTPACDRGGAVGETGAPSLAELASATYEGVYDEAVTLVEGRWEGEPFVEGGASRLSAGLVDHFALIGNLNGDDREETAVLLWESSGGSGTRLYLAVMGRRHRDIVNLGTALVGDRVQVRSGGIRDNRIELDVVQAGPGDAMCCPSQLATRRWTLGEGGLVESEATITGTLSLESLGDTEWVLSEIGRGESVPDAAEITILFHDDKVTGTSGCNRYFAAVTGDESGELVFSGMGATRMACPEPAMDLERRYLNILAGASSYSFLGGRLVLGCNTDDGPAVLIFTRREISSDPEDSQGGAGGRVE
jgi:heat shock protein HslJ